LQYTKWGRARADPRLQNRDEHAKREPAPKCGFARVCLARGGFKPYEGLNGHLNPLSLLGPTCRSSATSRTRVAHWNKVQDGRKGEVAASGRFIAKESTICMAHVADLCRGSQFRLWEKGLTGACQPGYRSSTRLRQSRLGSAHCAFSGAGTSTKAGMWSLATALSGVGQTAAFDRCGVRQGFRR